MRAALAGVAVVVAVAGCGGSESAAPVDREAGYVEELRNTHPNPSWLANPDARKALVAQGEIVCEVLGEGFTVNEVREALMSGGVDPASVTPLIDAARNNLCPEA